MKSFRLLALALLIGLLLTIAPALLSSVKAQNTEVGPPKNLVDWYSGKYVQLTWDLNDDNQVAGYNIYRSVGTSGQWEKLNKEPFTSAVFIDYAPPSSKPFYYKVTSLNISGAESLESALVEVQIVTPTVAATVSQALQSYDKNNIITDSQLTNASVMSAAQIQSFLSSQGSVLANYSTGGKTAAQLIYDDCQTHGISPYVVLVTLQKEKSLIRSSTANPNSYAMGWNTGNSSSSDFANQIYYGTQQFKLYYNNLGGYGWTVGQPRAVSDGTVTPANIATAGLYIYTPWIGQGGGGQTGVGGNYLFWDLWYNTFGFGSSSSSLSTMPSGWYWPTGSSNFCGYLGWLGYNSSYGGYHLAQDMCNPQGNPVYSIGDGDVILSRTDVSGYGPGDTPGGALVARYQASDGTWFTALYGHLNSPHAVGHVPAGDVIGYSNAYNPPHCHFGIHPGYDPEPNDPWRGYTSSTSNVYGFTDPIPFLNAHPPGSSCTNSSSTLRNIDGGPPIHPPGSLLKTASINTVYLIDADNKKRPITSSSVLAQLYNQSTDARTGTNFTNWVITVGQDELDLYEQGGNISAALSGNGQPFPDGKLIGYNGEVSIVTGGGKRRPFASESTFTGLGFKFCQVVNVSQTEYNSYPAGPWVDAMPMLTSSLNLSPADPYTVGQSITGSFTIKNVGYQSITFSSLGVGGRLNGATVYDMNFVSTTLAAGSSYTFNSQSRQLTSSGTYDFFAAYQENNGHWAISVPAVSGITRSRQISVANTVQNYTVTVSASPGAGGTVTGGGTFAAGSSVTVTASANNGYTFSNWTESGSVVNSSASYTFTLNSNRTLVANFTTVTALLPPPTLVDPGTTTAPGSSVGTVTPTFDWQPVNGADGYGLYVSRFNGSTYDLIFNSETDVGHPLTGTLYVLPSGRLQDSGQYRWNMSTHNSAGYGTPNDSRYYFYVSLPVQNYTITVSASPGAGGTVSGGGTFAAGSSRTVTATANSSYTFTNWTENGSVVSTQASYTFTLNGNRNLVANFTPTQQQTISVTVQTNPSGRVFTFDGAIYVSPQTFTLTPGGSHSMGVISPQSGSTGTQYVWSSWSDSGAMTHTIAPTSSTTYTANLTTQYFLTMNTGSGGTVSPQSGWYNSGQVVSISATPKGGSTFRGWTGSGAGAYSGPNNLASVVMNGTVTETANFTGRLAFDFDGDGHADNSVWRPSEGIWYVAKSGGGVIIQTWGTMGDVIVPADYDGDGKTDLAVWRPSDGNWYIIQSSNGLIVIQHWGQSGDKPVPGDYDGDGKADLAVWRESEGKWYILKSSGGSIIQGWGRTGDRPVPGDYDGDGKTDIAVWRPGDGNWYVLKSSGGTIVQAWGINGDAAVPADYDGDGRTDIAVWRPSEGNWYVLRSSGGVIIQGWGRTGDVPVAGDYDGDGKADIAVWRPSDGTWYVLESSTGAARTKSWGSGGDNPTPASYIGVP
jgi:hypothetical protein